MEEEAALVGLAAAEVVRIEVVRIEVVVTGLAEVEDAVTTTGLEELDDDEAGAGAGAGAADPLPGK